MGPPSLSNRPNEARHPAPGRSRRSPAGRRPARETSGVGGGRACWRPFGMLVVARRRQHWAATDEEVVGSLPGDDLIPGGQAGLDPRDHHPCPCPAGMAVASPDGATKAARHVPLRRLRAALGARNIHRHNLSGQAAGTPSIPPIAAACRPALPWAGAASTMPTATASPAGGAGESVIAPSRSAARHGWPPVLHLTGRRRGRWWCYHPRRRCWACRSMASQSGVSVQAGSATGCHPPARLVSTRSRSASST